MKDNFDLKKFLVENKITTNSKQTEVNELHSPIDYDHDAQQEQIIQDIADNAIANMMENPGTSALDALEAAIDDYKSGME